MKKSSWTIAGISATILAVIVGCTRNINPTVAGAPKTSTPTATVTNTPVPNTNTPTRTATNTITPTYTNTPVNTYTSTPTDTVCTFGGNTCTNTPTITPTDTPTSTNTSTPTNSPTDTYTPSPTPSDTPSVNIDFDNWQDGGSNTSNDGKTFIKCGGGSNTGTMTSAWLLGPPYLGGTSCLTAAVTNTYALPGRTNSLVCDMTFDASSNVVELAPAPWSTAPTTGTIDSTNGSGNPAQMPSYVSFWIYASAPVTLKNIILVTGLWGNGPTGPCDGSYTSDQAKYSNYNFVPPIGSWTNITIAVNGNASWVDQMKLYTACGTTNTLDWTQVSSIVTDFVGAPSSTATVALADYYFYP